MAILSIRELIDILIMIIAVGFIFKDTFRGPRREEDYDPIKEYSKKLRNFDLEGLKFSIIVTAPALLFHELGHKFMGMAFGLNPVFHAAYVWLGIGVLLKLVSFPFIFFVPAYVSYASGGTLMQNALIAFAGPGVNLILWIGSLIIFKRLRKASRRTRNIIFLTSWINMALFIFNMIPIPGFDGWHFFSSLYHIWF
jgi:membrane-associated protease RseP (regulator of RpoE activity)